MELCFKYNIKIPLPLGTKVRITSMHAPELKGQIATIVFVLESLNSAPAYKLELPGITTDISLWHRMDFEVIDNGTM